ncbi:hypothetical protein NMY22_g5835 [Coprinellus aureogranulatus]|nr:hypothetical protein NMY22_g5835 [Coprinellus aureogranulatus]
MTMMKLKTLAFVGWLFDDDMDCRRDGIDFSWPCLTHLQLIPEPAQPAVMYRDGNIRRKVSQLTHLSISDGNQHHVSQLTNILRFCPLLSIWGLQFMVLLRITANFSTISPSAGTHPDCFS